MLIEVCDKCESKFALIDDLTTDPKSAICHTCLAMRNAAITIQFNGGLHDFAVLTRMLGATSGNSN